MTDQRHTHAWRQLRAAWALLLPVPCAYCERPVLVSQRWHLDHRVPVARGGAGGAVWPAHAACNQRAGGLLRFTRRPVLASSRRW